MTAETFCRRRQSVTVVLTAVLLSAVTGCAHRPKPQAKAPPPAKPWMVVRSLCIFPMAPTAAPLRPGALADAMAEGWKARLIVPEGMQVVQVGGLEHYPRLDSLTIDVSDAQLDPDHKAAKLKPVGRAQQSLYVKSLEFVARPLILEQQRLMIDMTAADATLDLRRDKQGRPMLTLTDAREGRLTFEMPRRDLDALLLKSARKWAGKYGVSVDRTRLKLDVVDGGRSVRADLKLDTRLGILPAGLRFKARIDIDERLNGRVTRLSCEGDQLLGPIISSIVDPALGKYEGKTRPLVGFPWGDMRLQDVKMESGDSFRLEARFGNAGKRAVAHR